MSIRIKDLPPKTAEIINTTVIATEDSADDGSKTKNASLADVTPYTWGASDEDSPLSTGLLYTTEDAVVNRSIKKLIFSLKNAPTGSDMTFDVRAETGIATNVFATIFSTLPDININRFSSAESTPKGVLSTTTWIKGTRLQIFLITNDTNFAATGLKVTLKS